MKALWFFYVCLLSSCASVEPISVSPSPSRLQDDVVFARLATDIRFFYPSNGVAATDWDAFMENGFRVLEMRGADAESGALLVRSLQALFAHVAPDLRLAGSQAASCEASSCVSWSQNGYAELGPSAHITAYQRSFVPGPAGVFSDEIGGFHVSFPLSLSPIDDRSRAFAGNGFTKARSFNDRYVCLASMAKMWGVMFNFFPSFEKDGVKTWTAELPNLLGACSLEGINSKVMALRRSLTRLGDNHVGVFPETRYLPSSTVAVGFNWIDGKVIATHVLREPRVHLGDQLVAVDGKDVAGLIDSLKPFSLRALNQQADEVVMSLLLRRPGHAHVKLDLKREGQSLSLDLVANESAVPFYWHNRRVESKALMHVEQDILVVNFALITLGNFGSVLEKMATSRATVLDVRGYPGDFAGWRKFVSHLTSRVTRPLPMIYHEQSAPGQTASKLVPIPQTLDPEPPVTRAKIVALSSRFSVSQAEQALGYLQGAGIAIIGEPSYGANGDINFIDLNGGTKNESGLMVTFTGMEIRQRDGSRFSGVGIQPTHLIQTTQDGIREGRDELLEGALKLLK